MPDSAKDSQRIAQRYAPIVRGAFMGRLQAPCVIKKMAQPYGITIEIPPDAEDEVSASRIRATLEIEERLPQSLTLCVGKESIHYSCCVDMGAGGAMRGRVALVTGGAQGFGAEIVRGLCKGGAIVFIADMNIAGAESLALQLNNEYGAERAYAVEVNVGSEESVEAMFCKVANTTGGLDLCVSNAGVLRAASILEQDMKDFAFVTNVNYTGFAMITKYAARLMKQQFLGCKDFEFWHDIIQINSKSGLEGSNKNGAYSGGKFGGIGLVQSFAKELVEWRIKVNAICPGNFFDGPLWSDPEKGLFVQYLNTGKVPGAKTIADVKAFYEKKVPMGRGCEGQDVIKAIYYIVEQIYETGQALPVTGGQVMMR